MKLYKSNNEYHNDVSDCSYNLVVKPSTHRRRQRDETVESRRVGVGGVYTNSQLAHDDCRRIGSTIWKLAKQTVSVSVSVS